MRGIYRGGGRGFMGPASGAEQIAQEAGQMVSTGLGMATNVQGKKNMSNVNGTSGINGLGDNTASKRRYWVITLSEEHANRAFSGLGKCDKVGFTQACHGKSSPLARMAQGDYITFYCPNKKFGEKSVDNRAQYFLGLGEVRDDSTYQVTMFDGFHPYRRDINFIPESKEKRVDIRGLLPQLEITKAMGGGWGKVFKNGHTEIPESDFIKIMQAMNLDLDTINGAFRQQDAIKTFKFEHSVTSSKISPEAIWELWSNVNAWPAWDVGLESCKLTGTFEVGNTFLLQPKGAPKALTVRIMSSVTNESFDDVTEMPFGKINTSHKIVKNPDGSYTITHRITANILPEHAEIFNKTLGEKWKVGLPQSVKNIVAQAEMR